MLSTKTILLDQLTSLDFDSKTNETIQLFSGIQKKLKEHYLSNKNEWIIPYSHGLNSFVFLQLVIDLIQRIEPSKRKAVRIVQSRTTTDLPFLIESCNHTFNALNKLNEQAALRIQIDVVEPEMDDRFFVQTAGYGFPPPKTDFQYCCEKMKLNPMIQWLKENVNNRSTLLLSGLTEDQSFDSIASIDVLSPFSSLSFQQIQLFNHLFDETPWGESTDTFENLYAPLYENRQMTPLCLLNEESKNIQGSCGLLNFDFHYPCWNCPLMKYHDVVGRKIDNEKLDWYHHLFAISHWIYKKSYDNKLRVGRENKQWIEKVPRGRNKQTNKTSRQTKQTMKSKDYSESESESLSLQGRQDMLRFIEKRENMIQARFDASFKILSEEERSYIKQIWKKEVDEHVESPEESK